MKLSTIIYTPENMVFQYFLTLLGQMVHSDLVRQIEYIKVENEILRSKLPKQIRTTYQEKLKLIRYGLRVGGKIKKLIAIVNYSTYRRWINALEEGSLKGNVKIGKPRKTTKEIIELIVRMAKDNADWGYGRIMGKLKKLGIKLGRNTIKHYMIENDLNPAPSDTKTAGMLISSGHLKLCSLAISFRKQFVLRLVSKRFLYYSL